MARKRARSRLARERDASEAVPVASFSDIAFLLIIFFLVTTTLVDTKGFEMEVPAGKQDPKQTDKSNTVSLLQSGMRYNNKPVTPDQLRAELAKLELDKIKDPQRQNDRMILLESHPDVSWQRYYLTMLLIQKSGGIVATMSEEEAEGGGP